MTTNPVKQAIVRACTDAGYRARLLEDPRKALAEEGIEVPEGVEVPVHESSDDKIVAVLPAPQAADLGERARQLPSGPVADVPAGLVLEWRGAELIAQGRIDTNTAGALQRELERAFADIDLIMAGATYLSSAGLGALVAAQKRLVAHDCSLRLVNVPQPILNVLDIAGLLELFEVIESVPVYTAMDVTAMAYPPF